MQIHEKMTAIMKDVEVIAKDQKNKQQGYSYRGIDDTFNSLHDIFAKHEVFITVDVLDINREERESKSGGILMFTTLKLKHTFHAPDGSTVESIVIGEGMDSGDKSVNKAMSVGLKYSLLQTFLIPTNDKKDPETDDPDPKPKEYNIDNLLLSISTAKNGKELQSVQKVLSAEKGKMSAAQVKTLAKAYSVRLEELVETVAETFGGNDENNEQA